MKKLTTYISLLIISSILLTSCNLKRELIELKTYKPYEKQTKFYKNPFPIKDIGDPYVLAASDGNYYLFATSSPDGYYCWKSKDLVNWSFKKLAYVRNDNSWSRESFWAPEVVEWKGKYYLYYTAKGGGYSLRIGVAVSDKPDGPYIDAVDRPLFDFGYAAIDANVLIDGDKKYLYFSKDCSENIINGKRKSEIYGVELADDMISVIGEPVLLATPTQTWEKGSGDPLWNEGPEVIKHDNKYYLTYSANYFGGSAYSIGYAVSGKPLSGFEKSKSNPILTSGAYKNISGTGHHSFAYSPDKKELFFVYHSHTNPKIGGGNRQVNIDRAIFTEDGELRVNGPTISYQPAPSNSSQQNIENTATFKYNGENTTLLNDGIFSIHNKDKNYDFLGKVNEENTVVITAKLPEKKSIGGFSIYRSTNSKTDFKSADIIIDDKYIIKGLTLSESIEERSVIASIDPVKASKIEFRLYPKDGKIDVSLSEISIIAISK